MSIKIVLLKSSETLIADVKEFVFDNPETNEKEVCGYLFNKPHSVSLYDNSFLIENFLKEEVNNQEESKKSELKVALSPWILFTTDEDITVPKDWVVTIVEPVKSMEEMYKEKVNGQSS